MTITLTKEQERRIRKQLEAGRFSSETDVIAAALDLLERQDEMDRMREAVRANRARNADLSADEASTLASEAVKRYRETRRR